ncbi:MAG: glycosyltransferase family 4 protein [Candidatus Zhuqueibacterota bacterium]
MKIIIVGPSLKRRGGVTQHVRTLLDSPLKNDFSVSLFRIGPEYSDGPISVAMKFLATPLRFLLRLITVRPALVHFNPSFDKKSLLRELPMLLLCRLMRCVGLLQFHGGTMDNLIRGNRPPAYLRLMLRLAQHIVLLTDIQKESVSRFVPDEKISVLPNMVDCSFNLPERKVHSEKYNVLFLSRVEKMKGVYDIFEAIPTVLDRFPQACFQFAGEGNDRAKLETICQSNGLCGRVKFLGHILEAEKVQFLSRGDLFLFPSHHPEGMPYALLEAMAFGLPIIATPVGALREIISHEKNGLIVPVESPDMLAASIIRLLDDAPLRKKMRAQNRRDAETKYNITVVCEQFKTLYEKLTKQ